MLLTSALQKLETVAQRQYQALINRLVPELQLLSQPGLVGISGAQGSGKSTLSAELVAQLKLHGIHAAAVSLDDYYLSKAQRQQLAQHVHPLLSQRGVPGTHHIQQAIRDATAVLDGQPVALPQFDKAQDEPAAAIPAQQLDLLIVEGWCLGVKAQTAGELIQPVNQLEAQQDADGRWRHYVNSQLAGHYTDYWQLLKPLIWLKAPDWHSVCCWRAQQEQQLWQQRGHGMTETELTRFMLPFQRLTLASWRQLAAVADVTVMFDPQHTPSLLATD